MHQVRLNGKHQWCRPPFEKAGAPSLEDIANRTAERHRTLVTGSEKEKFHLSRKSLLRNLDHQAAQLNITVHGQHFSHLGSSQIERDA
jgi:hypothetical protein